MIEKFFPLTDSSFDPRTLRHNLRMHIGDGSLYVFGLSFMSVQTIAPVLIHAVGGNPLAISAVPVLWMLGASMPQAFWVHYSTPSEYSRPTMLRYGLLHRIFFFLIAGFILLTPFVSTTTSVILLLSLLLLTAVCGSVGGLPWFHVFTKTMPVKLRGRMFGLRQLIGSVLGICGGYVVNVTLSFFSFPTNFSVLYVIGFLIMMGSYAFLRKIIEPPMILKKNQVEHHTSFWKDAQQIFRTNKNFRNYLFADALGLMSLTVSAFYSVYALEKFHLPSSYAGTFTAIVMLTNVFGNIVFGWMADRFGNKVNIIALVLSSALASFIALSTENVVVFGLVFVFMANTVTLQGISRLPFIAEMCSEQERQTYIALFNVLTAPTMCIGIIFGLLVPVVGYATIFLFGALLALVSLLILIFHVNEPRTNGAQR